jgi:hypothetical protein
MLAKKYDGIGYSKGGNLKSWYDESYDYNKRNKWQEKVLFNLEVINILFDKGIFVSPSANKGYYEFEFSEMYPNTQFIATDVYIPSDHQTNSNNFTYINRPNNAIFIRKYLELLDIKEVDYIWDIKGALWHNWRKNDLDKMLKALSSVLSSNGCIVFDAYNTNNIKIIFNMLRKAKNRTSYIENSTLERIEKNLRKNNFYKENFTLIIVGDGDAKMGVLKRR